MRVLTVEDNPATRHFIRSTLECEGYDVAEAATGVEGLQLAERFRPHVILVDLLLPDMGGLELAERIRSQAEPRTVAIIGFTGALPEDEAAALRSGVLDDLLIKPADSRDLADAVARHLPRPHGPAGQGRPALAVGSDDSEGITLRLEALGFTVASVSSGEEALAAARETIPSLVVTEMSTCGLSGFELCVALRRDPTLSEVPVVLVSAFGIDDDDRLAARRMGANSLLSHPADLGALEIAIRDAMSSPPPTVTVTGPPPDPRTEYVAYLQRCLSRHSAWSAHVASMGSMRAAQLELIEHLAGALASSEDLDLALSTLVAELVHVLGASRGVVYITDFGGRPVPRAQLGYAFGGGGGDTDLGHHALLERAYATRSTVVVDAVDRDHPARVLEANTARSMAATPIAMGRECLGAVVVASQRDDLVGWAPFLDAIAAHLALAVRLAQTVDRLAGSERVAHARAQHDALTGMPNERVVVERLASAVDERNGSGAVLLVGIDRFRYLNARFGYRSGDLVLQSLASRLSARVGTDITIGRSGGDRFVVLAPPPHHGRSETLDLAARLLTWIAEPLTCEGVEHRLTASAGVVLFPAHGVDPSTLLWRADSAMRRAKDTGGGCAALFDPEWDPEASQRLVIHHELRSALGRGDGGLHLHYQPRLSLPSLRLTGAEALLRWDHAELGRLSPSAVVAVAEESGLMPQLGMWVLDAACAQIRAWGSLAEARPLRVAVNVAAQQLLNDDLANDVADVLRRWKLPGEALELEITETAAIQNLHRSVALLTEIRAMGVSIALDDFGTGYSSLAHLRRLPLDAVKIDRSFIRELPRDESNQAIVTAIIELAHRLGLSVVAEGVETQSQLDHLIRDGCDEAQGWLFAPALPADEFVRLHGPAAPSTGSS